MTVSIITVVFNGEDTLERTIKSIAAQTYPDIEYLIVDGQSADRTLTIIQNNEAHITRWISEPDKGLYDAMNKGLDMATGDYVWFMNAGDEIYAPNTLEKTMQLSPEADIYYGDTIITGPQGNVIGERRLKPPRHATYKSLKHGMLISHQAFIARKQLTPYFNLNYRYSADYDWMIQTMRKASAIRYTESYLARFLDGGRTKQTIIPGLKERFNIMSKHYGLVETTLRHFVIGIKFLYFWIRYGRF